MVLDPELLLHGGGGLASRCFKELILDAGLVLHIAVELPDVELSGRYQRAYLEAAKRRDDLLAPVITSQKQWQGREDKVDEIVKCLWEGTAPAIVFMALAVLKK